MVQIKRNRQNAIGEIKIIKLLQLGRLDISKVGQIGKDSSVYKI